MPPKRLYLVAGLGNPGDTYKKTRHNTGFMVLDEVAKAFSIAVAENKFNVLFGRGIIANHDVILAKPQAYMNRSGPPLYRLTNYYKILAKDLLIVHDDIDLTFGRIKIKEKGGHGGHKGLKSLIGAFGSGDFARIRLGVGRSEALSVTDHVLGRFSSEEEALLNQIILRARDAVVLFIVDGIKACMNRFNRKIE